MRLSEQSLKESADEIDMGTQYHLSRYAYLYEHTMVQDGLTISPIGFEDGESRVSLHHRLLVPDGFRPGSRRTWVEIPRGINRQPGGFQDLYATLLFSVRNERQQGAEPDWSRGGAGKSSPNCPM